MVSRDCIEYCRQRTLSSSWTGHLDSDVWTLTSTGAGIVSVLFINAAPPPHTDTDTSGGSRNMVVGSAAHGA